MTTQWILKPLTSEQQEISNHLEEQLNLDPTIAKMLVQRGICTVEEAQMFFNPLIEHLHDPFLMKDMDKAVDRLNLAIQNNEKVLIYGDYDVDGTTAVAVVYKVLEPYIKELDYYIPDRYAEGYGLSFQGIKFAQDNNFTLVISVDCGIKAVEQIKYAKSLGIDFIVCDHHQPAETLPEAVAVLDAKRNDNTYPFEHLSGCGVGFKFMQAFAISNKIDFNTKLKPLLDLVAVSTASDIVPILGENRVLAYYGLQQINKAPTLGLKAIINQCKLNKSEIGFNEILYKIGPRINASGRMRTGHEVVELLVTKDIKIAEAKSADIDDYNEERKERDKEATDQAKNYVDAHYDVKNRASIVVHNPDWHKGIVGIVASRIAEEYHKPTIILTSSNGVISGSARSVSDFDLYAAIESCQDYLENFGGHLYAAGLTLKDGVLDNFIEAFERSVSRAIQPEQKTPQFEVDTYINFSNITKRFFEKLKQFEPFGPENPKPMFVTENVSNFGYTRCVGKESQHLRLEVNDGTTARGIVGIGFGLGTYARHIQRNEPVSICYTIEENNYMNNITLQLFVKDVKVND